jgi:hypothetical protein
MSRRALARQSEREGGWIERRCPFRSVNKSNGHGPDPCFLGGATPIRPYLSISPRFLRLRVRPYR